MDLTPGEVGEGYRRDTGMVLAVSEMSRRLDWKSGGSEQRRVVQVQVEFQWRWRRSLMVMEAKSSPLMRRGDCYQIAIAAWCKKIIIFII